MILLSRRILFEGNNLNFIELNSPEDTVGPPKMLVNIANISRIWPSSDGYGCKVELQGDQSTRQVANDYDSIKAMLKAHQAL